MMRTGAQLRPSLTSRALAQNFGCSIGGEHRGRGHPPVWSRFRMAGVWIRLTDQPVQGIMAMVSGAVVAGSYFAFGSTVRYVENYEHGR
jgi:hypothetical protein